MDERPAHDSLIRDQFTKQADPFARKMATPDRTNFPLLRELTQVNPQDRVLDVACGPGIVACAFAEVAGEVVGLDLTPAMLKRARSLQAEKGLTNVRWELGDVYNLPYEDDAFSLVVTRYSLHHLTDPNAAVRELFRVCAPGGRVCVIDMVTSAAAFDAFNSMEKLRDPSHVAAFVADDLVSLVADAGLEELRTGCYRIVFGMEEQLRASAPDPRDADQFRQVLRDDVGRNALGVDATLVDGELRYAYTTLVVVGRKPVQAAPTQRG